MISLTGSSSNNNSNSKSQKVLIELKDAKSIFLDSTDWPTIVIPSTIAIITVIISSILTNKIARKQLSLSQKQIKEQSRSTLQSIRANNISNARIEWIQKLRPLMGKLITESGHLDSLMTEIKEDYFDEKTNHWRANLSKQEENDLNLRQENVFIKIREIVVTFNEIKLFLNHEEAIHKEFIQNVDLYVKNVLSFNNSKTPIEKVNEEILISSGRKILKHAWEQAKTDVSSY